MNIIKLKNIERAENHLRGLYANYLPLVQETINQTQCVKPTKDDMEHLMYQSSKDTPFPKTDVMVVNGSVETSMLITSHNPIKHHMCVLNFASYMNPGGGFLKGQKAQEECLCHVSTLFPALNCCASFYGSHYPGDGLYGDDYIYSRYVEFFVKDGNEKEDRFNSSVLTMAAPNYKRAIEAGVSEETIKKIFKRRMEYAYVIPAMYGAEVLFLGAWGCGVFGNDPEFVANTWKELQNKYNGLYCEVLHVIKDRLMYKTFRDIMC